jgi:small ligand-binding sensory domain FIST
VARQPGTPAVPILAANADGSLTLAEALEPGEPLRWAIRQPLSAEQDMRQSLLAAVNPGKKPDFGLMFSCLGRGPLFYGNDDRDLLAFREIFPGVPLVGAYGSGQIAPAADGNRLFQNAVVTLLCESAHV